MEMKMYGNCSTMYYDLDKPDAPEDELQFYLQFVQQTRGPVLEAMAGSGRFLLPILDAGFDIEGVDASTAMLAACRKNATKRGVHPVLYKQFLHELDVPKKYGLIIIPAGSIGLITDMRDLRRSLGKLFDHLRSGGRLVVEVETPYARPTTFGEPACSVRHSDDGQYVWLTQFAQSYDPITGIAQYMHRYERFVDGVGQETELEDFHVRLFNPDDFQAQLKWSGFVEIEQFQCYEHAPPPTDAEQVVFSCRKP